MQLLTFPARPIATQIEIAREERTAAELIFVKRMRRGDHGPRLRLGQPFGRLNAQTVYDNATGKALAEIRDVLEFDGRIKAFRVYYGDTPAGFEHSITLDSRALDVLFDYVELGVAVEDAIWTLVHH